MECEICRKWVKRRARVFVNEKRLYACGECVGKLRTHELLYCETCKKYNFSRKENRR